MNLATQQERRRYPRYPVDLTIRINRSADQGGSSFVGRGNNLGEGGLQVSVPVELGTNEVVRVEILIPYSSQPINLSALVNNKSGYTYGLEFMSLSQSDRNAIIRACNVLALLNK
jgi:hypothetical protein